MMNRVWNKAENIYFSKGAAESVKAGDSIAKGFFAPFIIVEATNANDEKRIKIARLGDSNRMEAADLFD